MTTLPTFIAFTGVDDPALLASMISLSARYPIEWGILIDDAQSENPLFPDAGKRAELLAARGLRWAAHVCGEQARLIASDPDQVTVNLSGFQRVQVNHGFSGSSAEQVDKTIRFGRSRGVRTLLQCLESFPDECRLDWLYDVSFGTGVKPTNWPALSADGPFCGYSGGINPENAGGVVAALKAPPSTQFWIDMESGVRTSGRMDAAKCEAVCRAVFG